MRRASLCLMTAAGIHLAAITSPAYAQVQPVPYGSSQPVPYNPAPTQAAPTPPPPTQVAPGKDVIHLKNGGMLRGTIVDAIPGSHARIQLPTGEIALVQWSEIARIESGDQTKRTPEAPTTTAPAQPARTSLDGPKVLVHIDSSRPVQLMRYDPVTGNRDEICTSPCDKWAPIEGNYRIEGIGVRQSGQFTLQGAPNDRVIIDVNPASRGWFTGGLVMGGLSLLGIIAGIYVVAIGSAVNAVDNSTSCIGTTTCPSTTKDSTGAVAVGWTIVGLSVALGVVGVIAFASNWSTSVGQETQEPVSRPAKIDPRRDVAWHDDGFGRGMPKLVSVPIFTRSF